ncbi:MAG: hypothetical protein Q4B82_05950 [Alysiella sp.]|uniref:hypothetical protein n=1 Tax=Alysiella sp. TaxID=1872483 RepID=UPI0026DC3134|nr:hypothetical protein [Alysiella sp.]MDO4434105.1 hypothetical protein [Alysiella sp.]
MFDWFKANSFESKNLYGFGYKLNWYMIPNVSHDLTCEKLAHDIYLKNQSLKSWNQGIDSLFDDDSTLSSQKIFISPNIDGWIYILTTPNQYLNILDNIVPDYYAFGSYRVVGATAFKKVKNHQIIRYFSQADGCLFANIGVQDPAERSLHLPDISEMNEDEVMDTIYSESFDNTEIFRFDDEEIVIEICKQWTGINPNDFESCPIDYISENGIFGNL